MEKLNILILTLVSGEEVICNLKDHIETVDDKQTKVCYNMTYPFTLTRSGPIENARVGVVFTPWKFFSIDTSFLIGYDKIINMCSPLPNVIEQYKQAVDAQIKSIAEQQR
jgi:hypothetical protein